MRLKAEYKLEELEFKDLEPYFLSSVEVAIDGMLDRRNEAANNIIEASAEIDPQFNQIARYIKRTAKGNKNDPFSISDLQHPEIKTTIEQGKLFDKKYSTTDFLWYNELKELTGLEILQILLNNMPKIQNLDGSIFDTETGELTLPEKPVEVAPSEAPMLDEPSSNMDKILQFSYGFNRGLFEMTDPIVEGIAKMIGVKDPVKIGDFVQVFNRGETAPKNRTERYARTLGDYTALTGSASGLLAFMARKGFLGRAEKTGRLSKSVTYDDKLVLSAPSTLDKALDITKDPKKLGIGAHLFSILHKQYLKRCF